MGPCSLSFDTDVPVLEGNPFIRNATKTVMNKMEQFSKTVLGNMQMAFGRGKSVNDTDRSLFSDKLYSDFRCQVKGFPFGVQIGAPLGGRPFVNSTTPGLPAAKAGLLAGDILVEVAGRAVNSSTWFAAFQQAAPPFGLRFRRRI